MWPFRALLLLLTGALFVPPTLAADEFDIFDINEGELRFLERPPEKSPHLHSTHVFISEESLKTGWVTAKQCHYHLDQVSALQVAFNKRRVRRIEILQADNIGRAWKASSPVRCASKPWPSRALFASTSPSTSRISTHRDRASAGNSRSCIAPRTWHNRHVTELTSYPRALRALHAGIREDFAWTCFHFLSLPVFIRRRHADAPAIR